MSKRGKIDWFHMMVIGKYIESIEDTMNIEIVNKKYNEPGEKYRFNPIPLNNSRSREIFSGIEEQHLYNPEDVLIN